MPTSRIHLDNFMNWEGEKGEEMVTLLKQIIISDWSKQISESGDGEDDGSLSSEDCEAERGERVCGGGDGGGGAMGRAALTLGWLLSGPCLGLAPLILVKHDHLDLTWKR